jgi:hypothetical protein
MFLQNGTPDTSSYMIAGYVVSFLVMGLYLASIYIRSRNLKQDMSMLEEMEKTEKSDVRQTISSSNQKL